MSPWDAIGIPDMKRSRLRWMPDGDVVCGALDMTIRSLLEKNDIDCTANTNDSDSIDLMTEAIQVTMAALREQAVARLGDLRKKRNEAVAQPKLPLELMVNVLSLSLEGRRYPLVRLAKLSTVSVGWWKTIRDTPSLWTAIPSEDPGTEAALKRSQNLPLQAYLGDSESWEDIDADERLAIQQRHSVLASQKHRWEFVYIHSDDEDTFLSHFDQPLPMLDSMWLGSREYAQISLQAFQGGPHLRSITLNKVQLSASSWTSSCVGNLEDLEISNADLPRDWAERIAQAVACSCRLSTLSLSHIREASGEPATTDALHPFPAHLTISTLETLRLLDVYPRLLHSLLRCIHGPSLWNLCIADYDKHPTALLDATGPSLLRAVLDINPPAVLHLGITHSTVRLLNGDLDFLLDPHGQRFRSNHDLYGVSMRTSDWRRTLRRLAEVVDTASLSIPIHLHLLAQEHIFQDGDDFIFQVLPSVTAVMLHSHVDVTLILQGLRTNCPDLREVCFFFDAETEEFAVEAKELMRVRPEVKVGKGKRGRYRQTNAFFGGSKV